MIYGVFSVQVGSELSEVQFKVKSYVRTGTGFGV